MSGPQQKKTWQQMTGMPFQFLGLMGICCRLRNKGLFTCMSMYIIVLNDLAIASIIK